MKLKRKGEYPYNLLRTIFGTYKKKISDDKDKWEERIDWFIQHIVAEGESEALRVQWDICKLYFCNKLTVEEIAIKYSATEDSVFNSITVFVTVLSRYFPDNPNKSNKSKAFLRLIISEVGELDAIDALLFAGINTTGKLIDYCIKEGTEFKKIPTLSENAKKSIRQLVEKLCK